MFEPAINDRSQQFRLEQKVPKPGAVYPDVTLLRGILVRIFPIIFSPVSLHRVHPGVRHLVVIQEFLLLFLLHGRGRGFFLRRHRGASTNRATRSRASRDISDNT